MATMVELMCASWTWTRSTERAPMPATRSHLSMDLHTIIASSSTKIKASKHFQIDHQSLGILIWIPKCICFAKNKNKNKKARPFQYSSRLWGAVIIFCATPAKYRPKSISRQYKTNDAPQILTITTLFIICRVRAATWRAPQIQNLNSNSHLNLNDAQRHKSQRFLFAHSTPSMTLMMIFFSIFDIFFFLIFFDLIYGRSAVRFAMNNIRVTIFWHDNPKKERKRKRKTIKKTKSSFHFICVYWCLVFFRIFLHFWEDAPCSMCRRMAECHWEAACACVIEYLYFAYASPVTSVSNKWLKICKE